MEKDDNFDPAEAADHYLKPHVCYADLKPGEKFRFPGFQAYCTKLKRGYRHPSYLKSFTTGAKTAVILFPN